MKPESRELILQSLQMIINKDPDEAYAASYMQGVAQAIAIVLKHEKEEK